ncbi:probable endochitinase, partial [Macrobrachium nipponense]|uniref:probable endochitinase n=1 Tax=Macrobrachium nipponense TaxID=159736 RepID=UPI0030C86761
LAQPEGSSPGYVVCYYSSWAHYRKGLAKYTVEDIPVDLCTHLIYAFATLDSKTYLAKPFDTWLDVDLKNYEKFVKLKEKNPKMKILLGVGGWNDSRSTKYSTMVADASKRRKFVKEVVKLLLEYGFDGLDLDWEYPGYESKREDKEGFTHWVEDLKTALTPHGLLLTTAVSASRRVIDRGYNVPKIMKHLDFINLMAYDFHGSWERVVAHHSPLYPEQGQNPEFNADFAVNYWIQKGAPASKIVLGVPFYGRSWTLAGSSNTPGSPATGAGKAGKYVKERGHMAYFECCLAQQEDGWTKVTGDGGPYLTKGDQWVGYDDIEAVVKKAQYARDKGLGGIMVWDTVSDDFNNACGQGPNPLLTAIYNTLQGNPPPSTKRTSGNPASPSRDPSSDAGSRPGDWPRAYSWKQPAGSGNVIGGASGSSVKGSSSFGGAASQDNDLPYEWLAWPIFSNVQQNNNVQTTTGSHFASPPPASSTRFNSSSTPRFSNNLGGTTNKGTAPANRGSSSSGFGSGQTTKPPYEWLSWPVFSNGRDNTNVQSNNGFQPVTPQSLVSSTSFGLPSPSRFSNQVGGSTNKGTSSASGPGQTSNKQYYDWQSWPIFSSTGQQQPSQNRQSSSGPQTITASPPPPPSVVSSSSAISLFSSGLGGETTTKTTAGSAGVGLGQTTKAHYDWQSWPIFNQSPGDTQNSISNALGSSSVVTPPSSTSVTKIPFSTTSRFSFISTTAKPLNRFGVGSTQTTKPPYEWLSWPVFSGAPENNRNSIQSTNTRSSSFSATPAKPTSSSFSKFPSRLRSKFSSASSAASWFADCKSVGFAPDPASCSAFYRCTDNHAYRFDCPGGLLWQQDQSSCDWPDAVQCILPVSRPNIAPFLAPESLSL